VAAVKEKHERFAAEYVIDLNATQAAIRTGYSEKTAGQIGFELLKKPEIQEAISAAMKARSERTEITADRVLKEIARLAFLDIRKAFNADGSLKPIHELDDDTAAAIAGLEVSEIRGEDGVSTVLKKIRLSDKRASLELAGRHLQMWNDKLALMNKDGSPLLEHLTVKFVQAKAVAD